MITLAAALVCFAVVICFWEELLCLFLFLMALAVGCGLLAGIALFVLAH